MAEKAVPQKNLMFAEGEEKGGSLNLKVEEVKKGQTYSFDEAFKASLNYFGGDELAARVWVNKYALKDSNGKIYERTPDDMHRRLASEISRIEQKYPNPLSFDTLFDLNKDSVRHDIHDLTLDLGTSRIFFVNIIPRVRRDLLQPQGHLGIVFVIIQDQYLDLVPQRNDLGRMVDAGPAHIRDM